MRHIVGAARRTDGAALRVGRLLCECRRRYDNKGSRHQCSLRNITSQCSGHAQIPLSFSSIVCFFNAVASMRYISKGICRR
jgi:hypothetical protein